MKADFEERRDIMKLNTVKFSAIILFIIPVLALTFFKVSPVNVAANINNNDTELAEFYKKNCALCHKPTAEKFFDTAKTDEEMVAMILNGKKMDKPPHMPAYKEKGVTEEKAKAMVEYMRKLRTPPAE